MISICSLIYRSTRYADAVWKSVHEWTPAIQAGEARFFFVANDASEQVLEHLKAKGYPHVVHNNARVTPSELRMRGFDPPEYIRRVYQGWNRAILESDERFILVNSDNLFSPGWFDALVNNLNRRRVVCSKLVERNHPKHATFEGALHGEFGDHPDRFKRYEFLKFCKDARGDGVEPGGAYMPCALHRSEAIRAGFYPPGNPRGSYGDREFFRCLAKNGVRHVTALGSLVYHFKEGEMDE